MAVEHTERPPDEASPLLVKDAEPKKRYGNSVLYRALTCGFFVSTSFSVTQVPILYVLQLMACDAYYTHHPLPPHSPPYQKDCTIPPISSRTATSIALLSSSTTLFGILNLLLTTHLLSTRGPNLALLLSISFPILRLLIQNYAVYVGGDAGIYIMQASQIVTVFGGPSGYLLALNAYVAEVVDSEERTGALGRLQGATFFGIASGFGVGGWLGGVGGIELPFRITVVLFVCSAVYAFACLPWLPRPRGKGEDQDGAVGVGGMGKGKGNGNGKNGKGGWIRKFFGPLTVFVPQRWMLGDGSGRAIRTYGPPTLGLGVFLGVLATGFVPILLQIYATNEYGFNTAKLGYLISLNCFVRGFFLTSLFPKIIAVGRKWFSHPSSIPAAVAAAATAASKPSTSSPRLSDDDDATLNNNTSSSSSSSTKAGPPPTILDLPPPLPGPTNAEEPTPVPALPAPSSSSSASSSQTHEFDLLYARYSLLADALITSAAAFVTSGWQLYIVAAVLPFASGTDAAAKGTMLQMCAVEGGGGGGGDENGSGGSGSGSGNRNGGGGERDGEKERARALSAISLVDMVARLATASIFGLVYAALAEGGVPYLIFICNGAVALLGFAVLLFCRFPPSGSSRIFEGDEAVVEVEGRGNAETEARA